MPSRAEERADQAEGNILLPECNSNQDEIEQEADNDEVSMHVEAVQHAKLDLTEPARSLNRYFEYIEIAGEPKAKCRLGCPKLLSRKNGWTSSMKWHLESFHNGFYSEYIDANPKKNLLKQKKTGQHLL